jgi:hypothetical protein
MLVLYCSCFNLFPLQNYSAYYEAAVDNAAATTGKKDGEIVPWKLKGDQIVFRFLPWLMFLVS